MYVLNTLNVWFCGWFWRRKSWLAFEWRGWLYFFSVCASLFHWNIRLWRSTWFRVVTFNCCIRNHLCLWYNRLSWLCRGPGMWFVRCNWFKWLCWGCYYMAIGVSRCNRFKWFDWWNCCMCSMCSRCWRHFSGWWFLWCWLTIIYIVVWWGRGLICWRRGLICWRWWSWRVKWRWWLYIVYILKTVTKAKFFISETCGTVDWLKWSSWVCFVQVVISSWLWFVVSFSD